MSRKQPATFHATDAAGRPWTIRVGPLGIEALTHEASERKGEYSTFMCGQQRFSVSWRDLLPPGEET